MGYYQNDGDYCVKMAQNKHKHGLGYRILGGILLAAGIIMLFTPGPGWATIFVGLYMMGHDKAIKIIQKKFGVIWNRKK